MTIDPSTNEGDTTQIEHGQKGDVKEEEKVNGDNDHDDVEMYQQEPEETNQTSDSGEDQVQDFVEKMKAKNMYPGNRADKFVKEMEKDDQHTEINEFDFHEDFMEKQSPSFHKRWQKRYFVLNNCVLKYYKNKADFKNYLPPKGVINFQQVCVEGEYLDEQFKINLKMAGCSRIFHLRCQKQESYMDWKTKLQDSIGLSNGKNQGLSMSLYKDDLKKDHEFWRNLRIQENLFKEEAQVGDLILCLTKNGRDVEQLFLLVQLDTGNQRGSMKSNDLFVLRIGSSLDSGIILQLWSEFRIYRS